MAKQKATKKTVISIVVLVLLLAAIAGLVYCMITGVLAEALGVKQAAQEPAPSYALSDGMAVTLKGADDVSELYVNTDKTVYAELAAQLDGADKILLVFTNKEITAETSELETSEAIVMIAHFTKLESGYVLLFESLIDDFGTEQDVILYDVENEVFSSSTSIAADERGKLTFSEGLDVADVLYCYTPGTCGISTDESVSAEVLANIFATAQFEAHQS